MGLLLAVVKPQAAASKEVNAVARPRHTAGGQECFRGVPRGSSEFMERFSQGCPKVLGTKRVLVEEQKLNHGRFRMYFRTLVGRKL